MKLFLRARHPGWAHGQTCQSPLTKRGASRSPSADAVRTDQNSSVVHRWTAVEVVVEVG